MKRAVRYLGCLVIAILGATCFAGENQRIVNEFITALNQGDNEKVVQIIQQFADKGNPEAEAYLALAYQEGIGVSRNMAKAVELFKLSASKGNPFGKIGLASLYFSGDSLPRSYSRSILLYEEALAAAKENLALLSDVNLDAAPYKKSLYNRLKRVVSTASYHIGFMYETGKGVIQNYAKAVEWYRPAAEEGLAAAQRRLGNMYLNGRGVPLDYQKGAMWLKLAAAQKLASAQCDLARLYLSGIGITKDIGEAVQLYQLSANQNYAPAQSALGRLYGLGIGVEQNYGTAYSWFLKAADQGYAEAQYNLGVLYQNGLGLQKNYAEALKWYSQAAEQDLPSAQWSLAKFYYFGRGVTPNIAEAEKWTRRAANHGYPPAEHGLGVYFSSGDPAHRNFGEAFRWLEAAAEQNYSPSQKLLGDLYANGQGVPQDYEKAAYWYDRAIKNGNSEAGMALSAVKVMPVKPGPEYEIIIVDDMPVIGDDVAVSDVWVVDEQGGTAEKKTVVVARSEDYITPILAPDSKVVVVKEPLISWPTVRGACRITSGELIAAYNNNELAADRAYRKKLLETVGRVVKVTKKRRDALVIVSPDGGYYDGMVTLNALMRSGQTSDLENLRPGMVVFISGTCYGMDDSDDSSGVLLKDAVLVKY